MKIVYIAHPISGNVKINLGMIYRIARKINHEEPDVVPFAPYVLDCNALDDSLPADRARGMANNETILCSGIVEELWLYGTHISKGMWEEIRLCRKIGIPVIAKTEFTKTDLIAEAKGGVEKLNLRQPQP